MDEETTSITRAVTAVDPERTAIVQIDPDRLFSRRRSRETTDILDTTRDRRARVLPRASFPERPPRAAAWLGLLGFVWLGTISLAFVLRWIYQRIAAG